jgi:NAD(P)H-hydrate epimerase
MTTLTRSQVRELDRRAIEEFGVPGIVLMENAGRGAAEVLMQLNPERHLAVIFCGPGNNGGDGYVIARHLDIHGFPVSIVNLFADQQPPSGDAGINYRIARRCGMFVARNGKPRGGDGPEWIVDALFGTGLSRPLEEPYKSLIEITINNKEMGERVFAVDIPSGLDCDTGEPLGPCVRADHTVTFVAPKAGFANPAAKEWLGDVHVVGIGAPRKLLEEYGISVNE